MGSPTAAGAGAPGEEEKPLQRPGKTADTAGESLRSRSTTRAERETSAVAETNRPLRLSVVMPIYNEIATIRDILTLVEAQPQVGEIILVDDGSTDGTRDVLLEYAERPQIRVIMKEKNEGKGAALRDGIAAAECDIVLIQDADLEYDPGDYAALVEPIEAGLADVVYGSRFQFGPRRVLNYRHGLGNRFLTALSNWTTGLGLTDMETCYKAFRREVIQNIVLHSRRFGFEPEITARIAQVGCTVHEVPISYYGRWYEEGKKITWRDGVAAIWHIVRSSYLEKPKFRDEEALRAVLTQETKLGQRLKRLHAQEVINKAWEATEENNNSTSIAYAD